MVDLRMPPSKSPPGVYFLHTLTRYVTRNVRGTRCARNTDGTRESLVKSTRERATFLYFDVCGGYRPSLARLTHPAIGYKKIVHWKKVKCWR